MKLSDAELYLCQQLSGIYNTGEAKSIAVLALKEISGWSYSEIQFQKGNELTLMQVDKMGKMLERLKTHEPIQYILQKCWFYKMEFFVDHHVLIPRPETEELVDWIVRDVLSSGKNVFDRGAVKADQTSLLKILDVGTGSGCIALSLKKAISRAEVWGCDQSEEAISVARRNGASLNVRADFVVMDFLDELQRKQLPSVDIVVSNPPYVPIKEKDQIDRNVVHFEPPEALFVPDQDALIFYRAIADFGILSLHQKGSMYMEIHEAMAKEVVHLFTSKGYRTIEVRKDMQGKERMVKVER